MSYYLYRRSKHDSGIIVLQMMLGEPDMLHVKLEDGRFIHSELIGTEFAKSITNILAVATMEHR